MAEKNDKKDNKKAKDSKPKSAKKSEGYSPKKMCPKCNSRMAEHTDRYTCGKCHYTEFKSQNKGG